MKAGTVFVTVGLIAAILLGTVIGGVFFILDDDGENSDTGPEPAPSTDTPTPAPTTNPVANCLEPTATGSDGPGTTTTEIDDRTIESSTVEHHLQQELLQADTPGQRTLVSENLSTIARQHAETTAGGPDREYTMNDDCTLRTAHATVVTDDVGAATSAAIADTLRTEFDANELEQIRGEHDAVGIGVFMTDSEIHVSVVSLDSSS